MQDHFDIDELVEKQFHNAPEAILRKDVPIYMGGAVSDRTLANRDSLGTGIRPRLLIAGRVAYPKQAVKEFYRNHINLEQGEKYESK